MCFTQPTITVSLRISLLSLVPLLSLISGRGHWLSHSHAVRRHVLNSSWRSRLRYKTPLHVRHGPTEKICEVLHEGTYIKWNMYMYNMQTTSRLLALLASLKHALWIYLMEKIVTDTHMYTVVMTTDSRYMWRHIPAWRLAALGAFVDCSRDTPPCSWRRRRRWRQPAWQRSILQQWRPEHPTINQMFITPTCSITSYMSSIKVGSTYVRFTFTSACTVFYRGSYHHTYFAAL